MHGALDDPTLLALVTHWTPQPLVIIAAVLLTAFYLRQLQRLPGRWPVRRTVGFAAGVVVLVWTGCGFPQVYGSAIFWVWTSQTLTMWLGVPILLLSGMPVHLARAAAPHPRLNRFLDSRFVKVVGNPLVGPALVPLLSAVLFFGPLPGWAIGVPAVGWVLQLALVLIGAVMLIPLVGLDEGVSSLAVALSLAIGSFELVLDAIPGIVLRLHTTLATSWFAHRDVYAWSPHELRDQQVAGAIVWCIAEVIDLPFLYLVFRRWQRADARDAAQVDAVLEAERVARGAPSADQTVGQAAERDAPWWLNDPAMQQRLRRPGQ